jgi:hypothetical protein
MKKGLAAALFLGALAAGGAAHATTVFDYTGTVQTYDVTTPGVYDITAYGAQGGGAFPGKGAQIGGDVTLSAGTVLTVLVGGYGGGTYSGGGGGSTWIVDGATPLVVAGGGGGSGTCCGAFGQEGSTPGPVPGKGGLALSSGSGSISSSYIPGSIALGGPSFPCCGGGGNGGTAGGNGDESPGEGGFGGGGGGYSNTANCGYAGCGGSSFLASTVTELVSIGGENSGNGSVTIVGVPAPEPPAWATLLVGLGLGVFMYRRNNKSAAARDAA